MKKFSFVLTIIILFASITPAEEKFSKPDQHRFAETDLYVQTMVDSLEIVGLNYAILVDNKLLHQNSFGLASKQLEVPMSPDKIFPVASISKLFSSIALHKLLVLNGRSVDERVGEFLPERTDLPESWRNLTLRQLLSHTSGIPDQIDYGIYLAPESEQFVIESLREKPFSSEPGTESRYNATGFLLVRIIIEKLTGQDFEYYMSQEYFEKFGLNTASYGGFKKVIPGRVTCYQNINDELEMFPLNYSPPMYAGAGLNISMPDLVKWFQLLMNEKFVSNSVLEKIWEPEVLKNGKNGSFGSGWESYRLEDGLQIVGHGGAGISSIRHYRNENNDQNATVILLTNGALKWKERPNQINSQIASMVFGEFSN